VPLLEIRDQLMMIFARWGKPGAMRVDNGLPFGDRKGGYTTPLALWLIAHDIDMIWNKPYCPQMNAKVEKMQATTARWAQIDQCDDCNQLQTRLDEQVICQREQFPVTRLQNQTRLQAFPELEQVQRPFSVHDFDSSRVYQFLAQKEWVRKVAAHGQFEVFGKRINVSVQRKFQSVIIQFVAQTVQWRILDDQKKLIQLVDATNLQPDNIRNFTIFQ
jgi:transposase InsO family protein